MMPETITNKPRKEHHRPFPWPCGNCLKDEVYPETMPYAIDVKHDGQLYHLEIPALRIPMCRACGTLVFSNSVDDQILQALRAQLRLLTPEQIHGGREALGLSLQEMAEKLGVAVETLSRWEGGGLIQSRAMDNFLRVFFTIPEVREVLRGDKQEANLGIDMKAGKGNKCMNYLTCAFCGETTPESEFCTRCGKARKKWCPQCGEWKASNTPSLEVEDGVVLAESLEETKYCPDCGAELQSRRAAHE
jgi:putative zinc finger/helix-turn-helix YgiT family protein